jgi:alpha-glucosidase
MKGVERARLNGRLDRGVELDCGDAWACRILLPAPGLARVVFEPSGGFRCPRSWMVCGEAGDTPWEGRDRLDLGAAPPARFELTESQEWLALTSAEVTIEIGLAPLALRWHRANGALFAADRPRRAYGFGQHRPDLLHAMARHSQDRYYGLGDKTGALDLKGRRLRTVMTDALGFDPRNGDPLYKHWPFLIVRDGATGGFYGILYDNLAAGTFDLGAEHSNYYGLYRRYEAPDGDLDYWLILGPDLAEVVAGFARLTGRMAFGPRWSLGFGQTAMALTDAADAQRRIADFIDRCTAEAIPISAFHFGSGYTTIGERRHVFHWNREKFPAPEQLMAKFKAAGMRTVANLKPCLLDDHPSFPRSRKAAASSPTRRPAVLPSASSGTARAPISTSPANPESPGGRGVCARPSSRPTSIAPGTITTSTSCGTRMRAAPALASRCRSTSCGPRSRY